MAWTALTFSVGQILTAAQMNNLQSNFTAVADGNVGAPKIQDAALDLKIIDRTNIKDVVAGDDWYDPAWAFQLTGSTTRVPIKQWWMPRDGTYRVRFGTVRTSTNDTCCVALMVNSTLVTSEYCTNGSTFLNWTEDIVLNQGDITKAVIRTTITGAMTGVIQFGVSSESLKEALSIVGSDHSFNTA